MTPTPESLLEHASWASALARRLVGADDAEDLVQEAWLAALRTPPRADRPLRPWLGTVLGNFARMRARARGRRRAREERGAREEALPSAAELTEKAESQRLLIEALLELDESLREVLLLRFFEDLSAAEIARRQGVPASTVKSRLERALEGLRLRLDGRFEGGRRAWCLALAPLLRPSSGDVAVGTAVGLSTTTAGITLMNTIFKVAFWALVVLIGAAGLTAVGRLVLGSLESIPREEVAFTPLEPATPSVARKSSAGIEGEERESVPPAAPEEVARPDPAAARLVVRFLDGRGAPVEGVELARRAAGGQGLAHSGPDGRAAVELEASSHGDTLFHRHPWYATDRLDLALEPGRRLDLGDVVLCDGGALSGRVETGDGRPLAGAEVSVEGEAVESSVGGGMIASHSTDLGAARGVTGADGRFRLEGLLAGSVRVEVEAEEGLYRAETGTIEIRPGEESTGLVIVVPITPVDERIEGVVLGPDGAPVPHCLVKASYHTFLYNGSFGEATDDEGRFRFVVSKDVEHELVARRDGWEPVIREGVEPGTLDVELRFRESRPFELEVLGEHGEAVEEYSCAVLDTSGEHSLQWSARASRPGGRTTLRLPSVPFLLEVAAPGFAEATPGPFEPDLLERAGEPLTVTLRAIPGIRGRVLANGEPVAGAEVHLQRVARGRVTHDGFPARFEDRSEEEATTDGRGGFRLDLREAGEYVVRAQAEGLAASELGPFMLDPAVGRRDLELSLGPGGSIVGRVVPEAGRSPAGTVVAISRGDCWARTQRVGAGGTFRFEHLTPGPWQVARVDAELGEGHSMASDGILSEPYEEVPSNCVVTEGGETRFDLIETTAPLCILVGSFDFGDLDLSTWRAALRPAASGEGPMRTRPAEARLERNGSFELVVASEGAYRLQLGGESGVRFAVELDLHEGTNRWSARVEPASLVVTGAPAIAAYLWSGEGGLLAYAPLTGESADSITLDPVPAGAARIVAPDPELPEPDPLVWPILARVELAVGERGKADLR